MKRIITLIIALVMCLALVSCGGASEKEELYDKYERIIKALEREDYEKAVTEVQRLYERSQETAETTEDPNEIKAIEDIPGEWIVGRHADDEDLEKITFNEDGSCVIGDTNYTWEIYSAYETWYEVLIKNGDVSEYRFSVNKDSESGLSNASLHKYVSENETEYVESFYDPEEYTVIEITADNFNDYFEDYESTHLSKNSFDEIEGMDVSRYKFLKEEYGSVSGDLSEVAIEYSYVNKSYELKSYDYDTMTYELGEETYVYNDGEPYTYTHTLGNHYFGDNSDVRRFGLSYGSFYITPDTESVTLEEDFEIVRIVGKIYTYKTAE